jgi:hypothetical protein
VIGEGNIVEILVVVVGVVGAPAAIAALHAENPFAATRNRIPILPAIRKPVGTIHRHGHHRGIVDVRIIGIGIFERPSARPHVRPAFGPVALKVEDLEGLKPFQAAHDASNRRFATDFK